MRSVSFIVFVSLLSLTVSCSSKGPFKSGSDNQGPQVEQDDLLAVVCEGSAALDDCLSNAFEAHNVQAVKSEDFQKHSQVKIELGRMLFFDKILSGNNDMACATCHHPNTHTADRYTLSAGSGSDGKGRTRTVNAFNQLVPRHTPSLFNRGHKSFTRLFWDGRVQEQAGKIDTPAKESLPKGLDSVLAAQALFPPTSPVEMRGHNGENAIANLEEMPEIWEAIETKVMADANYRNLMSQVYPEINSGQHKMVHIANAIAAFEAEKFQSYGSPFDKYLEGDKQAMTSQQKRGAVIFYNKALCGTCHSGAFQTDHNFYNIASPQYGPGKKDGDNERLDFGRMKVTKSEADKGKFKTAPLRNVALTPPYGRMGSFATLESIIRHKLNPSQSQKYLSDLQLQLPGWDFDFENEDSETYMARLENVKNHNLPKVALTDDEIYDLISFLEALTDPRVRDMHDLIPDQVPSGMVVP